MQEEEEEEEEPPPQEEPEEEEEQRYRFSLLQCVERTLACETASKFFCSKAEVESG